MRISLRCSPLLLLSLACSAHAQPETTEAKPPRIDVAKLGDEDRPRFVNYLKEHARAPVDYLVAKCKGHEVVLLGEVHMVRENCELVAGALAPLYHRAGVRLLASEFVRSRNTERANVLITGEKFDDALAVEIFRDGPWPTWGFREYIDILRAAWKLNRELPADAEPLRVAGIDSDWDQYALWFTHANDARKRFDIQLEREKNMVRVVEQEAFAKKRRALVHVGYLHTLLCHGVRLGTVLHKKYGDRLFQVSVHRAETAGRVRRLSRLTRFLETLYAEQGSKPIGFDVVGSPLGDLVDHEVQWARVLKEARFADVNQGYVFLKPLSELHWVTWVNGFVTDAAFEKARAVAERLSYVPEGACSDPATLDARLAERFSGQKFLRPER